MTLVVWAVSLVRSVSLRALIYSLPLPITLVLLATPIRVSAQQLVGVVLLNVFVAIVTLLYHRLRWNIVLADVAGVAAYIGGSLALVRAGVPFLHRDCRPALDRFGPAEADRGKDVERCRSGQLDRGCLGRTGADPDSDPAG